MPGQLRYELIGDASQFSSARQEVIEGAQQIEGSLEALEQNIAAVTEGQLRFNEAAERFRDSSGQFVSGAEAQARALQELNSEGVQTTQQIREQIERLERLERVYEGDAHATAALSEQQERLRRQLMETGASAAQQNQDLSRLDQEFGQATVAMTNFASRQERLQQELRATAAAQDRVSSSGVTMRSSASAAANNLGFELAQAAQDARFGMAGVANQIPLMTEQFQQLVARTGSTSAAFSALGQSLLGPAGIILAVTQLIQLGPQLTSWFTESGSAAENAEDQFRGFFDTIDQGLPNIGRLRERMGELTGTQGELQAALQGTWEGIQRGRQILGGTPPLIRLAADAWDRYADAAERVTGERPGENVGQLLFGADTQQLEERTRRLRSSLDGTGAEAQLVRSVLNDMGADVETIVSGSFEQATQEVRQFSTALQNITQAPGEALTGRPGALADFFAQRFQRVSEQQQMLMQAGVQDRQESLQQQRQFLEEALRTAALQLPQQEFQAEFAGLLSFYQSLGGQLENLESQSDDAGSSLEDSLSKLGSMGEVEQRLNEAIEQGNISRERAAELYGQMASELESMQPPPAPEPQDMLIEGPGTRRRQAAQAAQEALPDLEMPPLDTDQAEDQFDQLASQLGRAIQAEELGFSQIGDQIGQSMLQSARMAFIRGEISQTDLQGFKQAAEEAGIEWEEAGEQRNQQLAQSIQLAAQLGTTMVQAAQQGQAEWNQVLGSILTTVGSAIAQANPAIGATIAGSGQLIGSFQHGGRVNTPLQWVGEEGPELIAAPQGSRVYDHETSMQMATPPPRPVHVTIEQRGRLQSDMDRLRADIRSNAEFKGA